MELTTGIAATVTIGTDDKPTEDETRTLLFAAFPAMWGQDGIEVEQIDGPDFLVTLPSDEWAAIQEAGYFEQTTKLGDGTPAKLVIEVI